MSLFTKSMKDVELSDVESFCKEGIEEGIRVEYKEDWTDNKKLAREIASFANTYGGLLLIGVSEKDRKPVVPFLGIDLVEGLEEKITSITYKGINPPVFPEIKVCPIQDRPNKAVLVIRVHESDDTPHRVEQDTKVYLRVSSQKEPVLAPFETIEWLINRRKKAIDNSIRILSRANKRFFEKYKFIRPIAKPDQKQVGIGMHSDLVPPEYKLPSTRGISVIPLYPHHELVRYLDLKKMIDQSAPYYFPTYRGFRNDTSMQDSMIYSTNDGTVCHTEINSFGLVFHKEDFSLDERNPMEAKDVIDIHLTMAMIYSVLSFAVQFYTMIGFWGTLKINVIFDRILQRRLFYNSSSSDFIKNEFDNEIIIERITSVFELTETVDTVVIDIYREIFWSLGARGAAISANLEKILENAKNKLN